MDLSLPAGGDWVSPSCWSLSLIVSCSLRCILLSMDLSLPAEEDGVIPCGWSVSSFTCGVRWIDRDGNGLLCVLPNLSPPAGRDWASLRRKGGEFGRGVLISQCWPSCVKMWWWSVLSKSKSTSLILFWAMIFSDGVGGLWCLGLICGKTCFDGLPPNERCCGVRVGGISLISASFSFRCCSLWYCDVIGISSWRFIFNKSPCCLCCSLWCRAYLVFLRVRQLSCVVVILSSPLLLPSWVLGGVGFLLCWDCKESTVLSSCTSSFDVLDVSGDGRIVFGSWRPLLWDSAFPRRWLKLNLGVSLISVLTFLDWFWLQSFWPISISDSIFPDGFLP